MKKLLIVVIAAIEILIPKKVFAVENAMANVDKSYQHELICEGEANNEDYSLKIKWNKLIMHEPEGRAPLIKTDFQFELKNLNQDSIIRHSYGHFLGEYNSIQELDIKTIFTGHFQMYKRLGQIFENSVIEILKINETESQIKFKNSYVETFSNPKNWCNPPTRLCGLEPISSIPDMRIETEIILDNAVCIKK